MTGRTRDSERPAVDAAASASGLRSGCPVQHARSDAATIVDVGTSTQASDARSPTSSSEGSSTGRKVSDDNDSGSGGGWGTLASWLPFSGIRRANIGTESASTRSATAASSASGGPSGAGVGSEYLAGKSADNSNPGDPSIASREAASSGCPVQHGSSSASDTGGLAQLLAGSKEEDSAGEDDSAYNPLNNEYVYGQQEIAGQEMPLSTARQRSSIPKADFNPGHQPQNEGKAWVYPSEQQYYNAIKRKGYKASARDMPSTLAIHNAVNEKGWEMVREWEKVRADAAASNAGTDDGSGAGVADLKLLRFTGRPKDISPKAWIKSTLLGYHPPFDRHDWVVKREDGSEARYVIDFYAGKAPPGSNIPVAMHLDVRPALDSFDALVDRTRMLYRREVQPWFAGALDRFRSDPSPSDESKEDAPPPSATR